MIGILDLGGSATPSIVVTLRPLQMALHANAKAEAGYRFYALYVRQDQP